MEHDFFYNTDHLHQYLSNSIIKIDGIPSIIQNVTRAGKTFKLYYLPSYNPEDIKNKSIMLADEAVDMSPICLGYFNKSRFENYSTYRVFRKPSRDWKIGISSINIASIDYTGDIENLLYSKYLFDLMINKFPSFEEALEIIKKKEKNNVAFNRSFALKGYNIYHCLIEKKIGTVEKNGSFYLFDGLEYLEEALVEAVNNEN